MVIARIVGGDATGQGTADIGGAVTIDCNAVPTDQVWTGSLIVAGTPSTAVWKVYTGIGGGLGVYWGKIIGETAISVQAAQREIISLVGTGLVPGTTYTAQLIGTAHIGEEPPWISPFPQPPGVSSTGGGAGGGGVLTTFAYSDKAGDVPQNVPGVFKDVGAGLNLSIPAAVGDVLELSFCGTFFVQLGSTGQLSLMADIAVNGVRLGGTLGLTYVTPATLNNSYAFSALGWKTVTAGDLVAGSVPTKPQFGFDAASGIGTLLLENNATLFLVVALKNLSR